MSKKKFSTDSSKILNMVIHSIYTNKDIFLRELLSNSSDACEKRKIISLKKGLDIPEFKIKIIINKKDGIISIIDNGVGMNNKDLEKNLGMIAHSGTQSILESLNDNSDLNNLIGRFGVGFYSVFMVADEVNLLTKSFDEPESVYSWHSDGIEFYTIKKEKNTDNNEIGTRIDIKLKEELKETYLSKYKLETIVKLYSENISFPIFISEAEKEDSSSAVKMSIPIVDKSKNEVSEEEYDDFYKHISNLPGKPLKSLHYSVEGLESFKALLFVPGMKPFDLFHPDRESKIKLYIKKVFISDKIEIVPKYLRFLKGVISCDDLDLNVSRETVQDNHRVEKIKSILVKKILKDIKSMSSDVENYNKLWTNFGQVLKEGLCDFDSDKQSILEICRFKTTFDGDEYTSIDDYLSRLKDGQKEIYYFIGDNIEILKSSPYAEGLLEKGYEILLFNDHVDGFWVTAVKEYLCNIDDKQEKYEFKSISTKDIHLPDDSSSKKDEKDNSEQDGMVKVFEEKLKGKVESVVLSDRLTTSPACLSVKSGALDIHTERYLIEQNQIQSKTLKILEVNPHNALIKNIYEGLNSSDESRVKQSEDMLLVIFDSVCVSQDEKIEDLNGFVAKIYSMMDKVLN